MSNANVGNVYQQIIRDVVESSRVDFEEGGVDEGVLEELSRGWQTKLSQLNVAQFPWDPKPEPVATPMSSTPLPAGFVNYQQNSNATPPVLQPQNSMSVPSIPPMNSNPNGPRIKPEPGTESPLNPIQPPYNPPSGMSNATTAQQRAAQNLQASYGARAAASINAMQNMPQPQPQPQPQSQNQPLNMQQNAQQQQQQQHQQNQRPVSQQAPRPPMTQAQYQLAMAQQAAQQRQQLQNQSGVNAAQTDGAGDVDVDNIGIVTRFDAQGNEIELGRVEIDHMIRRRIEAMGQRMEGGGLMLPLNERKAAKKSKRQRRLSTSSPVPSGSRPSAQFDGPDDGSSEDDKSHILKAEDADEDAINSDLDDPEDGLNDDDDDDDSMGHIMLCMYDKVQRVKNKWKCVMKDGVLTVNGKEYVFHKATGEYEW